ncbi:MAG: branched-chain amino acid aminotransferase [Bacteroidales bacterium]|nr:branched-chain amino acid aminotransferase [Bacteroidales bacterium]
MDWSKLAFGYIKTNKIICSWYKDGEWSPLSAEGDDRITISALSGALHYGIEAFEGLKAFRGVDGKVRLFRPDENAKRLKRSADFLGIASPGIEMFVEACKRAVIENIDFLPPYESRASMYLRPFLIGVEPQIDLVSSKEVLFAVAAIPVGAFSGKNLTPARMLLARDHDRAAPMGTGSYKIGGNYAASMLAGTKAKKEGFASILYLDSAERKYVDEFSSSNFFAVKGNSYITPDSPSVLPSITNKSLIQLAEDFGMKVEKRKIPVEELTEFDEVGACGTAVVITPVWEIVDKSSGVSYLTGDKDNPGNISKNLYRKLTGIQYGEEPDDHNWCMEI